MLWRMIKTLILLGISISLALTLLQAFLASKVAHGDDGPPQVTLPAPQTDGSFSLEKALATRRSQRQWSDVPLTTDQVGQLCWAAQGITDPPSGKRTCPSARGTYPLTLYALTADGVFRYVPASHALQRVTAEDKRVALGDACMGQQQVKTAALAFVIAADMGLAREKLGMESSRLVYLECGHCAQNVLLQAVALGLGAVPVGAGRDIDIREALQLPDNLTAAYVIAIGHPR